MLVSRERNGYSAALLGACWGIGHTASLVGVGAALIVLRAEMPASMTNLFEVGVAVMLIALGLRAIAQAARHAPNGPPGSIASRIFHRHPANDRACAHRPLDARAAPAGRRRAARPCR